MLKTEPSEHQKDEKPQEACGITAIFSKSGKIVSPLIPPMQDALQHRGKDAAGMAVFNREDKEIVVYKKIGKVREVFPFDFDFNAHNLFSDVAIGHNRYGTSGDDEKDSAHGAQPMLARFKGRAVAIAYNGNLPDKEREKLKARIPSELLGEHDFDTLDIAHAIVSAFGNSWEERIKNGLSGIALAYALTILTDTGEVFGLRGPSGHWPLWVGESKDRIIFSSETRVNKQRGISWTEVNPGELVKATKNGVIRTQLFKPTLLFRCSLHDQYGARDDSRMTDGLTYRAFRKELGKMLAKEYPIDADLYIGIPHSGIPMAQGYTQALGKRLSPLISLISRDRGFISRNDKEINAVISGKYAVLHPERLVGKRVVLIDDSLIRGKTTGGDRLAGVKGVVELVREAGATEIHFAVTLPRFTMDCDMGYYIRREGLVALVKRPDGKYEELSNAEIATRIGADSLSYLSLDGVKDVYGITTGDRESACFRCMGGAHPLDIIAGKRTIKEDEKHEAVYKEKIVQ